MNRVIFRRRRRTPCAARVGVEANTCSLCVPVDPSCISFDISSSPYWISFDISSSRKPPPPFHTYQGLLTVPLSLAAPGGISRATICRNRLARALGPSYPSKSTPLRVDPSRSESLRFAAGLCPLAGGKAPGPSRSRRGSAEALLPPAWVALGN
jgi:hypothetical protein